MGAWPAARPATRVMHARARSVNTARASGSAYSGWPTKSHTAVTGPTRTAPAASAWPMCSSVRHHQGHQVGARQRSSAMSRQRRAGSAAQVLADHAGAAADDFRSRQRHRPSTRSAPPPSMRRRYNGCQGAAPSSSSCRRRPVSRPAPTPRTPQVWALSSGSMATPSEQVIGPGFAAIASGGYSPEATVTTVPPWPAPLVAPRCGRQRIQVVRVVDHQQQIASITGLELRALAAAPRAAQCRLRGGQIKWRKALNGWPALERFPHPASRPRDMTRSALRQQRLLPTCGSTQHHPAPIRTVDGRLHVFPDAHRRILWRRQTTTFGAGDGGQMYAVHIGGLRQYVGE